MIHFKYLVFIITLKKTCLFVKFDYLMYKQMQRGDNKSKNRNKKVTIKQTQTHFEHNNNFSNDNYN